MSAAPEPLPPGAEEQVPGLEQQTGVSVPTPPAAAAEATQAATAQPYAAYGAAYPPGFEYYSSYYYPAYTTGESPT